ncbi:MAG: hypothetical protein Q9192_004285 [Flavoplaca navasiana]
MRDHYEWDQLNTVDVYVKFSALTILFSETCPFPSLLLPSLYFHFYLVQRDNHLTSPYSDVDDGPSDIADESTGLNRRHPKVFVGFFSHASFPEINKSRKTILNGDCPALRDLLGNEYRYAVEIPSPKTDQYVDTRTGVTIGGVYHAWKTFVQSATFMPVGNMGKRQALHQPMPKNCANGD